jgi:hypothetical protein
VRYVLRLSVLARRSVKGGTTLSPAERALFTQRRKDIYEALHPETRHEAFKGNQHVSGSRQVGDNQPSRFTADTAARTGQSERVADAVELELPFPQN